MKKLSLVFCLITLFAVTSCGPTESDQAAAEPTFTAAEFMKHVEALAADDMEGRGIGTPGGEKAAAYIADQFKQIGLEPAFDGSWYQQVPIRAAITDGDSVNFSMSVNGQTVNFTPIEEVVANSEVDGEHVEASGDLYFVGYGIEAPEYEWDDYKGFDPAGKILVMLVNDPDLEKTGFGGEEMTYYGRWTYKEEIARLKGAEGIIIMHTDETAQYGFNVVQTSWGKEQIRIDEPLDGALAINAWVSQPSVDRALALVGTSYAELKEKAESRDFEPMPLGLSLNAALDQTVRTFKSPNVAGVIKGTSKPDEVVIYTGHYDHLGVGRPDANGDTIYNGAVDNATGVSSIINMAQAYKAAKAPERTVMFMSVTAEEGGLLGSKYYVRNPAYALDKTALVVNLDGLNVYGEINDFWVVPIAATSIEEQVREIGEKYGMALGDNPSPGAGLQFRSDHFPFCAKNVVALSMRYGSDYRDKPEGYGAQTAGEYRRNRYHQPSDEITDDWDPAGLLQMTALSYDVGRPWADGAPMPTLSDENNPFLPAIRIWGLIDGE